MAGDQAHGRARVRDRCGSVNIGERMTTHDSQILKSAAPGVPVYDARDFRVAMGVNIGDPIGDASELVLDDVYHLTPGARPRPIAISMEQGLERLTVAPGSEIGQPGARLFLDCLATLMAPDGTTVEALVLVVLDSRTQYIAQVCLMPFATLLPRTDYALVSVDRESAQDRFVEQACASFARGTKITLGTGEQRAIELLQPGDKVLTRGNGVQPIRWIGQRTVRAQGARAPVVIRAGALNNLDALSLSPNHRVFIYQREDRLRTGRREVMVRAELLVNGTTVVRGEGGFVDYFQLLFDNHEIVYAEGIATESLPLDAATRPALPKELRERIGREGVPRRGPRAFELPEGVLDGRTATDVLRAASAG